MNFLLVVKIAFFLLVSRMVFALDYDYGKEEKYQKPVRRVSIIADKNAYYPENIVVFVGESVEFYVTGIDSTPSCFMMPEKEIFISAIKGELSQATTIFEKPGVHKFYCPKGKISGHVTVLLHPSDKKRLEMREIASKKVIKVWRPKDESNEL